MPQVLSGECSKMGNLVKCRRVALNTSLNLPKLDCTEIPYDAKCACLILLRNALHQSYCQRTACITKVSQLLLYVSLFIPDCENFNNKITQVASILYNTGRPVK